MKQALYNFILRCFLRVQTNLSWVLVFGLLLQDKEIAALTIYGALGVDIARFFLRKRRILPSALGCIIICAGLTLMVLAVYPGTLLISLPEPDYSGASPLAASSAFLSAFEKVDGGRFLFNLTIGMGVVQAGIFLAFSNERSSYLRRRIIMAKLPPLGFRRLAAGIVLQLFLLFLGTMWVHVIITNRPFLADPAAALQSFGWRLAMAIRFLVPCILITLVAYWAWVQLNLIAILSASDHKGVQQ
jgi:hypothetical protein